MADAHGCLGEVDVRPVGVHDFLLSHSGHQEELVPEPLFRIASRQQLVEFFRLVNLRFLFRVARPVVLACQATNSVRLQKRHYVLEFVVNAAWRLLLFVSQEGGKLE